jgi:hypothetical protein
VRLFDTAPYYGFTRSERRLGEALSHWPRDEFVLSTKVGRLMRPDDSVRSGDCGFIDPLPFRPDFDYSRDGVLRSFDESLVRLGVSGVDILYVHDIGTVTHGERQASYWQQLTKGGGRCRVRVLGGPFTGLGEQAGLGSGGGHGPNAIVIGPPFQPQRGCNRPDVGVFPGRLQPRTGVRAWR